MTSLRLLPVLLALVPALAFAEPPKRCAESTLPWGADMHPSALDRCVTDRLRERCTDTDRCLVACWTRRADLVEMPDGTVMPIGGGCDHICQTGESADDGPPPLDACVDRLDERAPPEAPLMPLLPPDAPTAWTQGLLAAMGSDPKALSALCSPAYAAARLDSCGALVAWASYPYAQRVFAGERVNGARRVVVMDVRRGDRLVDRLELYVDHDMIDGAGSLPGVADLFLAGLISGRPDTRQLPDDVDVTAAARAWAAAPSEARTNGHEAASTTPVDPARVRGLQVERAWRAGDVGVACFRTDGDPTLVRFERSDTGWAPVHAFGGYRVCDVELADLLPRSSAPSEAGSPASEGDTAPGAKPTPVHGLRLSDPIILGALDRSHTNSVLNAALPAMLPCFAASPEGRLSLKFTVDPQGTVSAASSWKGTTVSDPVVACVLEQAWGLQFDKPRGGGIVIATYPILWTP